MMVRITPRIWPAGIPGARLVGLATVTSVAERHAASGLFALDARYQNYWPIASKRVVIATPAVFMPRPSCRRAGRQSRFL